MKFLYFQWLKKCTGRESKNQVSKRVILLMKQYSYFQGRLRIKSRPKVYSPQAKSGPPTVFVNKVLLKYNHTYFVYILYMAAAFKLNSRVEYLLLIIRPTMPKKLLSVPSQKACWSLPGLGFCWWGCSGWTALCRLLMSQYNVFNCKESKMLVMPQFSSFS